ncbi:MAG: preprotein translocase subunit SecE [Planctomycetaceae bacterium]|nr:preprotein translocase subunit SecE [Planctomycetaceae bacterium]|tara:strand:- start:363 stop:842 length:480 start_codon:yes stop_codon:yes gene_type:complete
MSKNANLQSAGKKADQPAVNVKLIRTLFSGTRHRPTMGLVTRRTSMLTFIIVFALGIWSLNIWVKGNLGGMLFWQPSDYICGFLLVASIWFSYRIVHWFKFAEFLIAVQNEMTKVSWPKRPELIRSSLVVILTMFLFTAALFGYDLVWQLLLKAIGISA